MCLPRIHAVASIPTIASVIAIPIAISIAVAAIPVLSSGQACEGEQGEEENGTGGKRN